MSGRSKKSDIKYIQYAFPKDYKQLDSIIAFQDGKIKFKDNNIKDFCVHPEYDLPYKMLSMLLSETERYSGIHEMYKLGNKNNIQSVDINRDASLYIYTKRNHEWKDYIFQIPGIFDILGIKRNFKLAKQKKFIIQDIQEDGLEVIPVYKVIQIPILFLALANIKLNQEVFCNEEVRIILKKAITAYNKKNDSNEFDINEQQNCYKFLFEENQEQKAFFLQPYNNKEEIEEIEEIEEMVEIKKEISSIVEDYQNEMSKEENKKEINCMVKESEGISLPKYMRSIFIVLYEHYDCLPLIRTDKKILWNKYEKLHFLKNIDEVTGTSFVYILQYMQYQSAVKMFYEPFFKGYKFHAKRQEEYIKIKTEAPLIQFYTFCLLILYRVKCEKEEYKDIAQYTFERIFSLYLFDAETKLLHSTIDKAAKKISKSTDYETSIDELELKLAGYVYNKFSSEVLHTIYCSPGIYHRVELARFINQIDESVDTLEFWYLANKPDCIYEPATGEGFCKKIDEINHYYFADEKYRLYPIIYKNKDKIKREGIEELIKNMKSEHHKKYNEFYEGFYKKIEDYMSNQNKVSFSKSDARKIAKEIVESQQPVDKIIHYWLIFSSFVSKNNLLVELDNPL